MLALKELQHYYVSIVVLVIQPHAKAKYTFPVCWRNKVHWAALQWDRWWWSAIISPSRHIFFLNSRRTAALKARHKDFLVQSISHCFLETGTTHGCTNSYGLQLRGRLTTSFVYFCIKSPINSDGNRLPGSLRYPDNGAFPPLSCNSNSRNIASNLQHISEFVYNVSDLFFPLASICSGRRGMRQVQCLVTHAHLCWSEWGRKGGTEEKTWPITSI